MRCSRNDKRAACEISFAWMIDGEPPTKAVSSAVALARNRPSAVLPFTSASFPGREYGPQPSADWRCVVAVSDTARDTPVSMPWTRSAGAVEWPPMRSRHVATKGQLLPSAAIERPGARPFKKKPRASLGARAGLVIVL